jgi:putative heme degradation protein
VGDRHLEVPPLERRRGKMQRPSLQNGSVQGLLQLCEVGSVATQVGQQVGHIRGQACRFRDNLTSLNIFFCETVHPNIYEGHSGLKAFHS